MSRFGRLNSCCFAAGIAILMLHGFAHAGTIIQLSLGSDSAPNVQFDGTTLSTVDDGIVGTAEDQNTSVRFQGFIAAYVADIPTATASVSLSGLIAAPSANVFMDSLVIQNFSGGTFILRDPDNQELLSGALATSSLAGPLGEPGTGALFTTSFSTINSTGLLAPYLDPSSLTLSMNLSEIFDGQGLKGFSLQPTAEFRLASFTADVTLNIAADQIPEPAAATLLLVAAAWMTTWTARRRA